MSVSKFLSSAFPIVQWLPQYQKAWLRSDAIAGLTLAAYAVPVSVAYASLAGLPPQAGLYCYLAGGIVYAIFGTSRQLAVGPTSAISVLIGSALGASATGDAIRHAHMAMAVSIVAGMVGIIAWALHLGNATNFVSETILTGFKVGAGLVIASTQLPKVFGVHSAGGNFFTRIFGVLGNIRDTNLPTLGVGLTSIAILIAGERLLPRKPVALFVVILSVIVMHLFPLSGLGVTTMGEISPGLPKLGWPGVRWGEVDNLLALSLACFLLSYIESISVARTFARKHGYPISADQELLALGAVNFVAGLAQAYPMAGGMSQSAVNEKAGSQSSAALVIASAAIGAVLLFLTRLMSTLPECVLASVVLMAVGGLIRPRELQHLFRVSKLEFWVAMVAMVGVLAFGILKGVLLAAIFSILLLLQRASHPRIAVLGRLPGTGRFADSLRHPDCRPVPHVLTLRVESGLFYFNVQNAMNQILRYLHGTSRTELLILDLSTSANIDLAGVRMLRDLQAQVTAEGMSLALAEVHGQVRDLLGAEQLETIPGVSQRTRIASFIEQREQLIRAAG